MPPSPLSALLNVLTTNVQALEGAYTASGGTFPSLNDPFAPTPLDFDPALMQAKSLIVAAAAQLMATVSPVETLQEYAMSLYMTAGLGFVVDTNIIEILDEAGPQGAHVKDISAKCGVDASHLARVLRYLATRHVFREVTPNVFANNRMSSLASKSKPLKVVKANPDASFDNAPLAAFISLFSHEAIQAGASLSSWLQDPNQAPSPLNMAFKHNKKVWEWYEMPGNEWRGKRFTVVLRGAAERWPEEQFINGTGVKNLKDNSVVVDVGGSVGSCTLILYKANPKLKYIVQDLSPNIAVAPNFWNERAPEALSSGSVTLQVQDFFKPQAVKSAAVYFMRVVLHDWRDKDAVIIMKNLREAASKSSKVVVFDFVGHHVCETTSSLAPRAPVPYPLLANRGIAGEGFDTAVDLQMMNILDGIHRTEEEWLELGRSTGWKLESIVEGSLPAITFSAM